MVSVLIVEDEAFLALGHQFAVEQAGHVVFGTAASVAQATDLLKTGRPDFALLDIRLRNDELSYPIARQLRELGIPFAFVSGYPLDAVAVETGPVGVLRKPVYFEDLIAVLESLRN